MDASRERLLEETLERRHHDLDRRERVGNRILAGAFLTVAVLIAMLADAERPFSPWLALLFVAAYAVVGAVELWGDVGYAVPTQLVFVPMLLLLPTPLVPLLVAAATVLSAAGQAFRGRHAARRVRSPSGTRWFSVGPVLVLIALDAQQPGWRDWWVYALALGAQLPSTASRRLSRLWFLQRIPPRDVLPDLLWSTASTCCCPARAARRGRRRRRAGRRAARAPARLAAAVDLAREREASMRKRSSSGAPTAARRCCCATCSRTTTSTRGATGGVVALIAASPSGWAWTPDLRRTRVGGAPARHRQDRRPRRDHQQARAAGRRGVGDDEDPHLEGERMLDRVGGVLREVGLIVRASHERWDGGGYPDGLAGEAIPLEARIVSACDAFNAMTTDRSYRKALPLSVAVAELQKNSGTQFCPAVVDALVELVLEAEAAEEPGWQLAVAPDAAPAALRRFPRPARPDQRQRRLGRESGGSASASRGCPTTSHTVTSRWREVT